MRPLLAALLLTLPASADLGTDPLPSEIDAAAILDSVEFPHRDGPIRLPEITRGGNLILPGKAELVVTYCADTNEATVLDLSQPDAAPLGADLVVAIGNRCFATVMGNRERVTGADCFTAVCYGTDELWRRARGE